MNEPRYLVTVEFPGSSSIVWTRAGGWLTTRDRADALPAADADALVEVLVATCPGSRIEKIEVQS